jgi:hypothetical protein
MPRFCESNALPLLEETDFSVFHRFADLEESAHIRLTAARARADLFVRLWSTVPVQHPLLKATLRQLLLRQEEAPLTPRPFWELSDFLGRPMVDALAREDPEFATEIAATFAREVRQRLQEVDPQAIDGFPLLLAQTQTALMHTTLLNAVESAFATMPRDKTADAKATVLLKGSVEARQPLLVARILATLPTERRVRVALDALEATADAARSTLTDFVLTAAQDLGDPTLAAEVWIAQDRPLDALRASAHLVFSSPSARDFPPKWLDSIVARIDLADRLTWALEAADPAIAAWIGERGAEAAGELEIPLLDLIQRCSPEPNGANVLRFRLRQLRPQELRNALSGAREIRLGLLGLALRDTTSWSEQLIDVAFETLREEELLSVDVATMLMTGPITSTGERYIERLVPRLIGWLAKAHSTPEDVARWLGINQVRQAISRLSQWTLFSKTRDGDEDCLPNLAHAVAELARKDPPTTLSWITNLLTRPLANARSRSLERAAEDLAALLSFPSDGEGWPVLAATALDAVRRTNFPNGYLVVERTFPVLYAKLVKSELAPEPFKLLSGWGFGWDVAKRWRHWLLDQWLDRSWPPASFLRCLGDDEALLRRIAHRAGGKWRGGDFLKKLPGAAAGDPVLAERWTDAVRQVLGDSSTTGDYD